MTSAETTPTPTAPARRRAPEEVVTQTLLHGVDVVTGRTLGLHQAAVMRIGFGLVFLVSLLREYVNRREIWGDQSAWSPDMARALLKGIDGVSLLLFTDERWWFESVYVAAIVVAALFMLGWHTRAMSIMFAIMVVSFNSRSILMTDGGDTVLMLMSIYLAFTACGRVWSLDARRVRRTGRPEATGPGHEVGVLVGLVAMVTLALTCGWDGMIALTLVWTVGIVIVLAGLWRLPLPLEQVRTALVVAAHNCALFVIAAEMCFIYGAAGLYKVQGSYWQDGTATHYVFNLEYFSPWPGLSELLTHNSSMGVAVSYLTVFVQVGFVFLLFAKRAKYVAIVILLGMHLGIAILLGLPAFSASMSIGDALFLPTAFLLWTRRTVIGGIGRRVSRRNSPTDAAKPIVPAPASGAADDEAARTLVP